MLIWHNKAWNEYLYWQKQDKKTLKRINELLRDVQRSPFDGIGKPEHLEGTNYWSRRIDLATVLCIVLEGIVAL